MEACQDRFCYAIREINVSYNTENQAVSLLCTTPMPLDEEETLPRAIAKGSNIYEIDIQYYANILAYTADQPCNDTTPLLFELISGESHMFQVSILYQDFPGGHLTGEVALRSIAMNIHPNNSITVATMSSDTFGQLDIEKEDQMLNETSLECSVYEDDYKRACFCKGNHARDYCLQHAPKMLDPSGKGYKYYHIYGKLTLDNLVYYYYFELNGICVQRNSASALREAGGNESMSLCMSYNGTAAEAEYNSEKLCRDTYTMILKEKQSNFTVFAKFHDDEWHSLMWFDYLRWSKSYDPGNCSYEEQVLDGVVHPFAICMRRNVTEKFYKNVTQVDQTSSTFRITTDYTETGDSVNEESQSTVPSTLIPTLLDQDGIKDLSRIAEVRSIEDEALQRFFNPFAITSSAPREIMEMPTSHFAFLLHISCFICYRLKFF
ncbi:hypothetical protein DdX_18283 [Ditylenchus destructor]|uniref:Uncharacterized protein n=1 Tax=Ditylenchus destructor TaxID=166010 RepID=A0AAD4MQB1_9BILA|nr:hypothetical protein DdX_18283 [Ditylenchus destructor]